MSVGTVFRSILASLHQIKETYNWGIDQFIMRVPAVVRRESTFAKCIVVARVLLKIMTESTFSTNRAEVFIIKFLVRLFL